jgi:hypothetical protein
MVSSVGAVLEPWPGLVAAIDPSTSASEDTAEDSAAGRHLAWQTTVGQVVFLESVVHKPT